MKIFVISLKRSVERRAWITEQLNKHQVEFEFLDAIDGHVEPPHELFQNYNYLKRLWLTSGRMPSKGELGCYASHYLLWEKSVALNEPILVIEDDVKIKTNFSDMLPIIEEKVSQYGFLRLQAETHKGELHLKEQSGDTSISFMTNNFGGTLCYAVAPNAAKKLISQSREWCMPVDNYMGSIYLHNMPCYILKPSVVENPDAFLTMIQLGEEKGALLYRKPTRELYSVYRKIMMKKYNKKYI
ncbi:glycosyltransferase family 25 protein [Marinomonas sp.]|uniref:glycosyltransferase family 25 protein n=1 Tax=Marinomonas sp. TaxID=1904862 RepID=UPI003F984199